MREIIMWLPKDERRLLWYYYHRINKVGGEESFDLRELTEFLVCKNLKELRCRKKERRDKDGAELARDYLNEQNRVNIANKALQERGLIRLTEYPGPREVKRITLNLEGYDLGRLYSSWWTYSGLWFREYKDHWIWIIVSFLGGVIGALLINWLSK
jgi:hypothetical protein